MDSVAARTGLRVGYICRNGWPEMITAIEDHDADLGVLLKSDERERKLLFSKPIDMTYLSFFARSQSSIDASKLPEGYTVGVIKGSMSYEQLKDRPGLRLHSEGSYHEGILSLLAGEIGLFAGEESMILKRARETRLDDRIRKVGQPFVERERGFAVRKDNGELLALLNSALPDFIGSPEYQDIYLKWYGAPLPFWTPGKTLFAGGIFLFTVLCGMVFWRYRSLLRINAELTRNITERKTAEESLLLFTNLINQSNDAIFVNDPATGHFLMVNDKACANLGYERRELLTLRTMDIEALFPDQASWDAHVNEVRTKGYLLVEGLNRRQDGTLFPVEVNVTYMTLEKKDYMVAVVRDITERKRAEAALQTREKQLAESQRIAHIGSWEHNLTTGQVFWSDELFRLLGLDPKMDPGDFKMFFDMIHHDDQPMVKKGIENAIRFNIPFNVNYRFIPRDGTTRILHAQAELIHDESGTQNILSGTGQDITEQKLAEDKLRKSEAFIKNILETVDEGFIVIDREYRILSANKAYLAQAKLPLENVLGKHCYLISHKLEQPCFEAGEDCAVRRTFDSGEPDIGIHTHRDEKGMPVFVEIKSYPIKSEQGDVTSVIEIVNNVTEKRKLEEQLRHSQKMEAVGQLAGGIAHDFNNILTAIIGYGNLTKMKMAENDPLRYNLRQMLDAAERAANLTRGLLAFSRKQVISPRPVELNDIVRNVEKLLSRVLGEDIELKVFPSETELVIKADSGQIEQVLMNLATNARDAAPEGGMLTIRTEPVVLDSAFIRTHGYGKPGPYALLSVSDTGTGMDEDTRENMFEPFFTTKEVGKGTGLGLSIVYGIVKQHEGYITCASEPGRGSTFTIYLPMIDRIPSQAEIAALPPITGGAETVLLAEDDTAVRTLMKETLTQYGYTVITAVDGEDAISKYQANRDKIQLIILDVIMPKKTGKEVYASICADRPDVKAIFTSGYTADALHKRGVLEEGLHFLSKPVSVTVLMNKMRELLQVR